MKYIQIVALWFCFLGTAQVHGQAEWWGGYTVNEVVDNSVLIFEGRILSDSTYFQNPPGLVAMYHQVLVLKKFKGDFKSDTISVVNFGGKMILNGQMEGGRPAYARVGDEAVFLVNTYWNKKSDAPDFYLIGYGSGVGFVTVCDKVDVNKNVYEPIEAVTGHPYIDVHPNTCANQKLMQQK